MCFSNWAYTSSQQEYENNLFLQCDKCRMMVCFLFLFLFILSIQYLLQLSWNRIFQFSNEYGFQHIPTNQQLESYDTLNPTALKENYRAKLSPINITINVDLNLGPFDHDLIFLFSFYLCYAFFLIISLVWFSHLLITKFQ